MSITALDYIRRHSKFRYPKGKKERTTWTLLQTLADRASEEGHNIRLSKSTLMEYMECSSKVTVQTHLRVLEEAGEIIRVGQGHQRGSRNYTAIFTMPMPDRKLTPTSVDQMTDIESNVDTPLAPPTVGVKNDPEPEMAPLTWTPIWSNGLPGPPSWGGKLIDFLLAAEEDQRAVAFRNIARIVAYRFVDVLIAREMKKPQYRSDAEEVVPEIEKLLSLFSADQWDLMTTEAFEYLVDSTSWQRTVPLRLGIHFERDTMRAMMRSTLSEPPVSPPEPIPIRVPRPSLEVVAERLTASREDEFEARIAAAEHQKAQPKADEEAYKRSLAFSAEEAAQFMAEIEAILAD